MADEKTEHQKMSLLLFLLAVDFHLISGETTCPGVNFITRSEWNARPTKSRSNITGPVDYVFIHHTSGAGCDTLEKCKTRVRGIQDFHMDVRGWDDIGYSFLIGGDGNVYIGRDWGRVGAHTLGYNSVSYGISLIGTYTNKLPTPEMMEAAKKLIACGIEQGFIKKDYGLYGHRDGRCTECPGDDFYQHLSSWDRWHARGKLPKYYC